MSKYLLLFIGFACFAGTANAQCPVDFLFTANGLTVTFNPTNPNVDSSFWDFGDGVTQVSDQPSVTHTYAVADTYTICLTTTGIGCTDTFCQTINICGFTAGFTTEITGSAAAFNNLSTGDVGLVVWDFGDGFSWNDTALNDAYHSYGSPGTYTVCVITATADNQCLTPYCESITVIGGGECIDSTNIDPSVDCAAAFDPVCSCNGWSYENPCEAYNNGATSWSLGSCPCDASLTTSLNGLTVTFFNTSFGDYQSFVWNFGDGNVSTDTTPVHTYSANGTYITSLSIFNGNICNDIYYDTITVTNNNDCVAQFDILGSCDSAVFVNASTGGYSQHSWNITGSAPMLNVDTVSLTDFGTYVVCLSVQGDSSCSSNYCDTFKLHAPDAFEPGLGSTFTPASLPVTVAFQGTDTAGYADFYTWDFGDGGTANVQNPTHVFNTCEVNVCMTVSDKLGCSETVCDSMYVCDVSVRSVNNDGGFALYPNPGNNVCYVVAKQAITGNAKLIVTDVTGRVIGERSIDGIHQGKAVSINTTQYAKGCYFFNIVSSSQTSSIRWIKE